jgi:hypothetical protein
VRLGVPKRLVGKRFRVTPVLGVAQVNDVMPITTPIVCADNPFEGTGSALNGTWMQCIDAPASKAALKALVVKVKMKAKKKRKR